MPPIHFWGNSSSISNQFLAYSGTLAVRLLVSKVFRHLYDLILCNCHLLRKKTWFFSNPKVNLAVKMKKKTYFLVCTSKEILDSD